MRIETLELLRCPYCGGRLALVDSLFHRRTTDEIHDGILGCHCCIFPLVDGIPVLHVLPAATVARDHLQAGRPELARRVMFGLDEDSQAEAFDAVASSETATYRDTVDALGPNFEGGYFLYRFSDPTTSSRRRSRVRSAARCSAFDPASASGPCWALRQAQGSRRDARSTSAAARDM
jgi:uncharacterized protein YbaR (Trm112 family)